MKQNKKRTKKQKEAEQWKKFKRFVSDSLDQIINNVDLPYQDYTIQYLNEYKLSDTDKSSRMIEAQIDVQPEYQSFTIFIFKTLFEKFKENDLNGVFLTLCHELGHVHTTKMYNLVERSYKTEEEVRLVEEELATKIGNYIYLLCPNLNKAKKNKKP